ncbi:hypothetical protein GCM10027517_11860 [Phycicoccus ginsengisoli]
MALDHYTAGLRCQDVNAGLRTFDATSPVLTPMKKTQLVGMGADLAALVRDQDLISDMDALEAVAAAELDIPSTSFDGVLTLLEDAGLVELTRNKAGVTGLTSQVPFFHDLYDTLGSAWDDRAPSQLEQEVVAVVDRLARSPLAVEGLTEVVGIETSDVDRVLDLGTQAQLIKSVTSVDGTILYSPYTAFENPALLNDLAAKHGSDRLAEEFALLKDRQGLSVRPDKHPLLYDAIGRGLIIAPSVELPGGAGDQPFATMPYTLDKTLLIGEKPILDKALAILACVRCGEEFGGFNNLSNPWFAVNKLLTDGALEPHSSSSRQYRLMRNKGIIEFGPDKYQWGSWVTPTLIDTPDNRRALKIAADLLEMGEAMSGRQAEDARDLLSTDARYLGPMKTVKANRPRLEHKESEYAPLIAAVMGYGVTT